MEDRDRGRERAGKGREGKGAREEERRSWVGDGEREHLQTRGLGVVYTEIKIKAVTVNQVGEGTEIKYGRERDTSVTGTGMVSWSLAGA